jgi:enoyl-CoA hydratase/carnithine racemase
VSTRLARELLDRAAWLPHPEAMELEAEALLTCMQSNDWREGIAAFHEKREPVFKGR